MHLVLKIDQVDKLHIQQKNQLVTKIQVHKLLEMSWKRNKKEVRKFSYLLA